MPSHKTLNRKQSPVSSLHIAHNAKTLEATEILFHVHLQCQRHRPRITHLCCRPPRLRRTHQSTPSWSRQQATISAWETLHIPLAPTWKMTTSNATYGGHLGTVNHPHPGFIFPRSGAERLAKYVFNWIYRRCWPMLVGWDGGDTNTCLHNILIVLFDHCWSVYVDEFAATVYFFYLFIIHFGAIRIMLQCSGKSGRWLFRR